MSKTSLSSVALAFASVVAAQPASATVALVPGSFVDFPGTTVGLEPTLAGTVIEDEVVPFSFNGGSATGAVQSRVVRSTLLGTLNFSWRVTTSEGSTSLIERFRLGEFGETSLSGDWRIDSIGEVGIERAIQFTSPFEDYVNFEFEETLGAGEGSHFFFLRTDATDYDYGAFYDLTIEDATVISGSFPTFRPAIVTTPVPAPATLALFGMGILASGARRFT